MRTSRVKMKLLMRYAHFCPSVPRHIKCVHGVSYGKHRPYRDQESEVYIRTLSLFNRIDPAT